MRWARREERRSCTFTTPSYHPEMITLSDAPQGADGGAPLMPYTAEARGWSSCVEFVRMWGGVEEMRDSCRACTVSGVNDDAPRTACFFERCVAQLRTRSSMNCGAGSVTEFEKKTAVPLEDRERMWSQSVEMLSTASVP